MEEDEVRQQRDQVDEYVRGQTAGQTDDDRQCGQQQHATGWSQ
jgi:hypothetical protein